MPVGRCRGCSGVAAVLVSMGMGGPGVGVACGFVGLCVMDVSDAGDIQVPGTRKGVGSQC